MKGNPMKEKVIFTLSIAVFFGIMWLSSRSKPANVTPIISENSIVSNQASNSMDYMDDSFPETTIEDDVIPALHYSTLESCSLKPIETDVFTFGDAFQYYRQCMGSDSSFQWKGSTYTTIIAEEVIIQIADSVQVKEATEKNNEVSEIH